MNKLNKRLQGYIALNSVLVDGAIRNAPTDQETNNALQQNGLVSATRSAVRLATLVSSLKRVPYDNREAQQQLLDEARALMDVANNALVSWPSTRKTGWTDSSGMREEPIHQKIDPAWLFPGPGSTETGK